MKKFLILFLVLLVFLTFALPTFAVPPHPSPNNIDSSNVVEIHEHPNGFKVYVNDSVFTNGTTLYLYLNDELLEYGVDYIGTGIDDEFEFSYTIKESWELGVPYFLTCFIDYDHFTTPFSEPLLIHYEPDPNAPANSSEGGSVGKVSQITGEVMSGVDVILPGVAKTAVTTVETVFWNANGSLTSLGTLCIIGIVLGVGFGLWLMLKKRASKLG